MATPLILAYDADLPLAVRSRCRDFCESVALTLGEIVLFAGLDRDTLDDLRAWILSRTRGEGLEGVEPVLAPSRLTTPAVPRRAAGAPDWANIAAGAADLALFGGPPLRAASNQIEAPDPDGDTMVLNDAVMELRRGVFEVTGLFSEPVAPCWLAITCDSRRMAAWWCAAMILENVEAKCEGEVLFVPASPEFRVDDEVLAIVGALAKVHRYWRDYLAAREELNAAV